MPDQLKLLIADDHPIFRHGLKQIIETDSQLKIVGEAADGEAALEVLPVCGAEIIILDVDMPKKDGFEVVRSIQQRGWRVEPVFLTLHRDERFLNAALNLGVKGYVLKDSAVNEIGQCVKAVAAGKDYVSPQLSTFLIRRSRNNAALLSSQPQIEKLSPTERRCLSLIADFKTNKEIAQIMCISVRTVEHHRVRIGEKLDLKGSHSLLRFAVEHRSVL